METPWNNEERPAAPTPARPVSEMEPAAERPAGVAHARVWAAVVLAACSGVLGIAVWLKPDPRGYGTHQQLGAGPCGMILVSGLPCPTCGMTTAFAHTVRGQWLRAARAQPAGFVLALATIALAAAALWTLATGRWPALARFRLTPFRLFGILLILLLSGWGFKLAAGFWDGTLPIRGAKL